MQALKSLVAGMGILIVLIMGTIAYGLYRKADDPDFTFFSLSDLTGAPVAAVPAAPARPPSTPRAFGEALLALPEGCSIAAVSGDGVRIFLKLGPAGGACERIIVLDAESGARLGTIKAAP